MIFNKTDLQGLDKKYRLNLINSISGVKPANLIGTSSPSREHNLAIFSSIVHLGTSPAHFGFVTRTRGGERARDTFYNIMTTGYYTINHVSADFMKRAHYTSANLANGVSEFEKMNLKPVHIEDFPAPFVADSIVKMGMKYVDNLQLPNGTTFVVGELELVEFADHTVNKEGKLDLSTYDCVGISGLSTYYGLEKLADYPHVLNHQIPNFHEEEKGEKARSAQ